MARRNPPAKWTLPTTVNPSTHKCIQVNVPDDQYHIAAFRGAMLALASGYNWADDPTHKAKDVALVWRAIIDAMDWGCLVFDVRQNTEVPCHLDKSTDGGTTWNQWADLQLCPPKVRNNKGALQWWNGSAWVALPDEGDERQDGTYDTPYPPGSVPSGQTAECLAAENILVTYSTVLAQIRADIAASKAAVAIAATATGVLGLFIEPAFISTAILALIGIALDAGTSHLDTLLGSTALDKIKCNLYCHENSVGELTASAYSSFYTHLSTDFSGIELSVVQYYFDCLGPVGLNRQAKANNITSATCTCDDCATVGITYNHGSGPSSARVGENFTMTPIYGFSGTSDYYLEAAFSQGVKITVVSATGWTPSTAYGGAGTDVGWWNGGTRVVTSGSDPTVAQPGTSTVNLNGIWSHTDYSLVCRIDEAV